LQKATHRQVDKFREGLLAIWEQRSCENTNLDHSRYHFAAA
jgi:hypothetical protein